MASAITTLEQPTTASSKIKLPSLPQGFTASIHSSTVPSIIKLDGTIILPATETTVRIELEITRASDGSKAITIPLSVKVPARTTSPGGSNPGGNSGGGSGGNSGGSSGGGTGNSSGGTSGNSSNPGSNGGQTGNGNTGSGPSPASPQTGADRAIVELQPSVDAKGIAQSKVDSAVIEAAVKAAPLTGEGTRLVEFNLKAAPKASAYEITLPVSSMIEQKASDIFRIVSEIGAVELPADLLVKEGVQDGTIAVRFVHAALPQAAADRLGTAQGVQLELTVNDKAFVPKHKISLQLPYVPLKDVATDRVIAVQIGPNGEITPLPQSYYDEKRGEVVFSDSSSSLTETYVVVPMEVAFADLTDVPWAQKAMEALAVRGVVDAADREGITQLHPKEDMTRAQFVQWLVSSLGLKASSTDPFKDVTEQSPYYHAINAARSLGITDGAGNGRFLPESTITRQEMMVLTVRALEAGGIIDEETQQSAAGELAQFKDEGKIRSYARDSISTLVQLGIVSGYNGEVKPLAEANRAESAALLYAMMSKLVWKK